MAATEKHKQKHAHTYSSPLPNPPSSSSLLKDISNFKTPKPNPNHFSPFPQQFFTASKLTPTSSPATTAFRRRPSVSRRLRAFELQQTKSARKTQVAKEKALKSLASSLSVWLNFLFQNPSSCGVVLSKLTGQEQCGDENNDDRVVLEKNGKRGVRRGGGVVGSDRVWRGAKRRRDVSWRGGEKEIIGGSNWGFSELRRSISEVCSFDDLKERMTVYLSLGSCKEIFEVMSLVTKVFS